MTAKFGQKITRINFALKLTLPKTAYHSTILSIHEAAQVLGVADKTLRRWEESNVLIPLRSEGGHSRYKLSDIERFKKQSDSRKQSKTSSDKNLSTEKALISQSKNAQFGIPEIQPGSLLPQERLAMRSDRSYVKNDFLTPNVEITQNNDELIEIDAVLAASKLKEDPLAFGLKTPEITPDVIPQAATQLEHTSPREDFS